MQTKNTANYARKSAKIEILLHSRYNHKYVSGQLLMWGWASFLYNG
jgi:hypothetical protein